MASDSPSFEGYTAVERLSSGPTTTLYCATQQLIGRKVVIKTLSSGILPDSVFGQNIEREATILSGLQHPGIVTLHDLKRSQDKPWLVREWVPGWTLSELLRRLGTLTPRLALGIACQVAHALGHAHNKGIVHRGVQPDCIVVSASGETKLISFARASTERVTRAGDVEVEAESDSLGYEAPEQLLGEAPDARVDIFSLGALLLHMLTGRLPGTRESSPELEPRLQALIARCRAQPNSERYPDGQALAEELDTLLRSDGVTEASTAVALELQRLGLATGGGPSSVSTQIRGTRTHRPDGRSLHGKGLWILIAVALVATLALALWRLSSNDSTQPVTLASVGRAQVRVVVEPWARVYVNDQYVDVTPFADPIILPPGTHLFRFEHPNAPVENRQVSIVAGESMLLDVGMAVRARGGPPGGSDQTSTPAAREPGP